MLNLLFRVRLFFLFLKFNYILVISGSMYIVYDDMALVITITIVRERIGNSVVFFCMLLCSLYTRTSAQFSSCEFQVNIFAVRWFTIVLLACNETCPMNSYRYLKDASKYDFISQGWINCCNAWLITHSI